MTLVAALTAGLADEIAARSSGTLVVRRGLKFPSHTQWSDFLSAPLDTVRVDEGGSKASVTLTGTTTEETTLAQTRSLVGVSYRNASGGETRARSAIDTYLRPGDDAQVSAGETITISSMTYYISHSAGYMEIVGA